MKLLIWMVQWLAAMPHLADRPWKNGDRFVQKSGKIASVSTNSPGYISKNIPRKGSRDLDYSKLEVKE